MVVFSQRYVVQGILSRVGAARRLWFLIVNGHREVFLRLPCLRGGCGLNGCRYVAHAVRYGLDTGQFLNPENEVMITRGSDIGSEHHGRGWQECSGP